jgi:16S rRNA (guanine527-N7)-methyltransferase
MTSVNASLHDRLVQAAETLGLELSPAQCEALLAYLALLHRWNSVYNLTSVRDPARMVTLHLVDCMAMVQPLRRHLADTVSGAPMAARLLDVGSGAGLPGVVVAALNPMIAVTCAETVGKKAAFLQQVAAELRLPNLLAVHGRVEQLTLAPFDVVTARAFAALPDFVALTRRHLTPTAVWVAMKGQRPSDELAKLPADVDVIHVEPLSVPGLNAERCLVWMRPHPATTATTSAAGG